MDDIQLIAALRAISKGDARLIAQLRCEVEHLTQENKTLAAKVIELNHALKKSRNRQHKQNRKRIKLQAKGPNIPSAMGRIDGSPINRAAARGGKWK